MGLIKGVIAIGIAVVAVPFLLLGFVSAFIVGSFRSGAMWCSRFIGWVVGK